MDFFGFLNFGLLDFIEIILVAVLLYYVYKLVKGTAAINIFIGIVIIFVIWQITKALDMKVLSTIFGAFIDVGILALFIVFQQEIRKFLLMIGSTNFSKNRSIFGRFQFLSSSVRKNETDANAIVRAVTKMASTKTGALMVLERNNNLDFLVETGDQMNIELTQPILESIFFKNSPLHDGAIIISNNTIKATRIILPVSNKKDIPSHFGLRHRAAIGITEKTDALSLVVSEETGQISYINNGAFVVYNNTQELIEKLKADLA